MAQYAHLAAMDADLAAAVARFPPPPNVVDIAEARKQTEATVGMLKQMLTPQLPAESEYIVKDHQAPTEGAEILVRSIVPVGKEGETFPLLFWIHGGGWCLGNIELDDYWLRRISVDLRVAITNVEYRLAPEYPFPTGLNDCYAALKWAAANPSLFNASLDKGFVIAGCSAGANLTAALAYRVRDDPFFQGRPVTGQILQVPATIHPEGVPEEYKSEILSLSMENVPIISSQMLRVFPRLLAAPKDHPEYSVLLNKNRKGLCPALIQIAGQDLLRDEGLLYEKLLKEAGVSTRLEVYPGLPHGAHLLVAHLPIGQKFEKDFRDGLRWMTKTD